MLELSDISKSFPSVHTPALSGINFSLKRGDFCVIIGANGSGKSTLLRTINGDYEPCTGQVLIDNQTDRRHLVAQVGQDVNKGTVPELTLFENIALGRMRATSPRFAFYNRHQSEVIRKVEALNVGLESYINRPLASLSGGQRQMIATLMAIESDRKVLLLDEHTSALDPKMQAVLMEYTAKAVTESRMTTMMITHKIDDAIRYGNRLFVLNKGKIVLDVSGAVKYALKVNELLELFDQDEA